MSVEWPQYRSHKIVAALPIMRIDEATRDPEQPRRLYVQPDPRGGLELFEPSEPGMAARVHVTDYAIRYRDGFRSVCPKREFEDGYQAVSA
jgi:hypothetical protein